MRAARCAFLLFAAIAARGAELVVLSGRAMGTQWTVRLVPPEAAPERESLQTAVAMRLEELERQLSTFRANSELSRFNASRSTGWVPVSSELAHVAIESRAISELTGGAFDPTVAPLVRLWGFGAQRRAAGSLPAEAEIAAQRARVDWRHIEAREDSPALRKQRAEVAADYSSLAKGFAVDEIAGLLAARGVRDCFVQIAGDIVCRGRSAEGTPWHVGIAEPRDEGQALACAIALADRAVSTSGDYRNFFITEGRRYSHLIDPRTGRPASSALASVSVVHGSGARSSALATGLFVLGPDEGLRLATREGLACLFIVREGTGFRQIATREFERLRASQVSAVVRR